MGWTCRSALQRANLGNEARGATNIRSRKRPRRHGSAAAQNSTAAVCSRLCGGTRMGTNLNEGHLSAARPRRREGGLTASPCDPQRPLELVSCPDRPACLPPALTSLCGSSSWEPWVRGQALQSLVLTLLSNARPGNENEGGTNERVWERPGQSDGHQRVEERSQKRRGSRERPAAACRGTNLTGRVIATREPGVSLSF